MLLASSYPFLDVLWTMFIFFLWVIWFWLLFTRLRRRLPPSRHPRRKQGCSG